MFSSFVIAALSRGFKVRPEERRAVVWALLYVGALFLSYYVLRPIRDEMRCERHLVDGDKAAALSPRVLRGGRFGF